MSSAFFGVSLVLLAGGIPIFVTLCLAVLVSVWLDGMMPTTIIVERMFAGVDKWALMAIPFFILTGNLMASGGVSKRIIRLANLLVGRVTGGLGMTAVTASMFFSAISGSAPATVVAVGKLLFPALTEGGYSRSFSIGVLTASGSLGVIIPPSLVMIVYAAVTGVSVGALFLAGVGAGMVYGLCFIGYCWYYARKHNVPKTGAPTWAEIWDAAKDASWGLGVPFLVIGGIYGGVFTPTEAAAVAVVYAGFVALAIHREQTLAEFFDVLVSSATTTAQVMIMLSAASVLSWFLTVNGLAIELSQAILSFGSDPVSIFMLINVTVLIAGMFLDAASIMVILGPLFYKIGNQVGIDPIHLGVVLTVNGAIGMFTPPFGLNLFVASSVGDVTYGEAVKGALPFIAVALVALVLITYVPEVSMWLPSQAYEGVGR